jgi:hypothetical protein
MLRDMKESDAEPKSTAPKELDGTSDEIREMVDEFTVMAAWAYTSGLLHSNDVRRKRHYALADSAGKNPLNAGALAKGRHKTDPENYRGLGYRTDPKERGRFVELFYLRAGKGQGINSSLIDLAILQIRQWGVCHYRQSEDVSTDRSR